MNAAGRTQDRVRRRAVLPMRLLPPRESLDLSHVAGSSSSVARSPSSSAVCAVSAYRSELNDHGNAARPSQHRDMACWATAQERHAAAVRPVDFQKPRRRQIVCADYRAIRDFGRLRSPRRAAIRSTRSRKSVKSDERAPKILIVCGIVNGDLRIERRATKPHPPASRREWPQRSDRGIHRLPARRLEIRGSAPPLAPRHLLATQSAGPRVQERRAKRKLLILAACRSTRLPFGAASTRTNGPRAKPIEAVLPLYASRALCARIFIGLLSGKSVATRSTSAADCSFGVLARTP